MSCGDSTHTFRHGNDLCDCRKHRITPNMVDVFTNTPVRVITCVYPGKVGTMFGPSPGEVAANVEGAGTALASSPGGGSLAETEAEMVHDPEEEVTVISEEGIGKGILRGNTIEIVEEPKPVAINVTLGPAEIANIMRFIRKVWQEGDQKTAYRILQAGWPEMKAHAAVELMEGRMTLEEAVKFGH